MKIYFLMIYFINLNLFFVKFFFSNHRNRIEKKIFWFKRVQNKIDFDF